MDPFKSEPGTAVVEPETQKKVRLSPRWQIIGLNDDKTEFNYVVMLLEKLFHKSKDEALQITLEVHQKGQSLFHIDSKEVCELKVEQVKNMNRQYNQQLRVRMEPQESA